MEKFTKKPQLNAEQRSAVDHQNGPMMVIAGAGTGKTRVIVERIQRLITQGTPPDRLLALTFTEKAAAEMLDRVNQLLGGYQLELPIMTFNSYGEQLLRRYGAEIGLGRSFRLMGESAQIVFLSERIEELKLDYFAPVSKPDSMLGDIAEYFSQLKQYVIFPDTYMDYAKNLPAKDEAEKLEKKKHTELAQAYRTYLSLCRRANVIDYDDQIFLVLDLLRQRPNVLQKIQQTYDYIMVDEFQDTNAMQSELIDTLVDTRQNLLVVGDDDQSIYGWRGATLANILQFKERYPKSGDITLHHNYRSSQNILEASYRLITHNNPHRLEEQLKINKKLSSDKSGVDVNVCSFKSLDHELSWVAGDIQKRIQNGTPAGDIAVMARRNRTTKLLHEQLELARVPHVVAGERYDLYQNPTVATLLEAIRTTVDPLDNTSLYHTLTGPLFSIPASQLTSLNAMTRRSHESLETLIETSADATLKAAQAAVQQIQSWRQQSTTLTVGQLAYEILDSSGYKSRLFAKPDDAQSYRAGQSLSELFKTIRQFEHVAVVPSALQYIEALPALQAAGDSVEDSTLDLSQDVVNVLTIHKAKGLEWPVVYIIDCTEGSFPLRETHRGLEVPTDLITERTSEADTHIAEERRLMYVAMTRARDELIMTHAEHHSTSTTRKPSRFLLEAFDTDSFPHIDVPTQSGATLELFDVSAHPEAEVPIAMLTDGHVHLSVSQLSTYLDCPLEFYYRYVLAVPQEPSPTMRYGTLMHGLIEDINKGLMSGELPTLTDLQKRLEAEWPQTGYMSAHHRDRAYEQAQEALGTVYARLKAEGRIPVSVEEPFAFTLDDEINISISGRFDAVLPLHDSVEIVDYKTSSSVDTATKAKSRASGSQQLTFYALAWQLTHDHIPALVTLDFIQTGQKGSIKKTQRGLDGALKKLQAAADGIRARNFAPGKDHRFCTHPEV